MPRERRASFRVIVSLTADVNTGTKLFRVTSNFSFGPFLYVSMLGIELNPESWSSSLFFLSNRFSGFLSAAFQIGKLSGGEARRSPSFEAHPQPRGGSGAAALPRLESQVMKMPLVVPERCQLGKQLEGAWEW